MKSLLFIIIPLVSILTACNRSPTLEAVHPAKNTEAIVYAVQEVPVAYDSVSDLSLASDVIMIGIPVATRGIINAARDPNDLTKPDPRYYGVSEVFEIQVEKYLKGEGLASIYVIQSQGFLIVEEKGPSTQEIEQARISSKTVPALSLPLEPIEIPRRASDHELVVGCVAFVNERYIPSLGCSLTTMQLYYNDN